MLILQTRATLAIGHQRGVVLVTLDSVVSFGLAACCGEEADERQQGQNNHGADGLGCGVEVVHRVSPVLRVSAKLPKDNAHRMPT